MSIRENRLWFRICNCVFRDRVLIIDDLLATGGSANAAAALFERLGAEVAEITCLIELGGLQGRQNLKHPFYSLISIEIQE